jgi:hypothetical protein
MAERRRIRTQLDPAQFSLGIHLVGRRISEKVLVTGIYAQRIPGKGAEVEFDLLRWEPPTTWPEHIVDKIYPYAPLHLLPRRLVKRMRKDRRWAKD